jgi:Tfp pilus assembly PilM family ATPase/Tfp pilus assembly protein PilN
MKAKKEIFICQLTEGVLKVIKCRFSHYSKREFVGLEVESFPSDINDEELAKKLNQVFKKLEYKNNPIIVSLPRQLVTCRYLKIPSQVPEELERIAKLQAPRYLPYSANELITGFQSTQTDKEGYSHINLIIAHRDVIGRYLDLFKELKPKKLDIVLSPYGLCNLYSYIKPEEPGPAMLIDIDSHQVELAIVSRKKLLFSRSFKFVRGQANSENLFVDEINKTQEAYFKEVSKESILSKIFLVGAGKTLQEYMAILKKRVSLPIEAISYSDKIKFSKELLNSILNSDSSFASLLGLGLGDLSETLNLLPQDVKEKKIKVSREKEQLRLLLFILSIILIWILGITKNLDNKEKYLQQLKSELSKISKEAKLLEEIDKRFTFMQERLQQRPSALDVLYELHKVMPAQISLVSLIYEEDEQVVLRGQTQELNSVSAFVSQLERISVFKNFSIKLRYATQKKTITGEVVDFEIVCSRR